ncbi:predicted protein [Naegleria gruberi]|uniref:Predicted protein n=1 Tax=Naegleria gruberi TaxID=5762 RepID=D2W4T7_NAEGR|nr:uncharacterized protein NAEGRDRAFT_54675 [Naegleria gruberi]EFC35921.1 predicted protein [Naegleria gruberi]|eukprot:XP_002668665.1 predicted protein [Naegleria gruberi strain NEG-M]
MDEHFSIIPSDKQYRIPKDTLKSRSHRTSLPRDLYLEIKQAIDTHLRIASDYSNKITKYLDKKYKDQVVADNADEEEEEVADRMVEEEEENTEEPAEEEEATDDGNEVEEDSEEGY